MNTNLRIHLTLICLIIMACFASAPSAHAGTYQVRYPDAGATGWDVYSNANAEKMPRCIAFSCTISGGHGYGVKDNGAAGYGYIRFRPAAHTTIEAIDFNMAGGRSTTVTGTAPNSIRNLQGDIIAGLFNGTGALTNLQNIISSNMRIVATSAQNHDFSDGVMFGIAQDNSAANTGVYIGLKSMTVTLDDSYAPVFESVSSPAHGQWVSATTMCVSARLSDQGSGIHRLVIIDNESREIAQAHAGGSGNPLAPGLASAELQGCFSTAALSEGDHDLTVVAYDASGNQSSADAGSFSLQLATPTIVVRPAGADGTPYGAPRDGEVLTNRQPEFIFNINPGISGASSSTFTLVRNGMTSQYDVSAWGDTVEFTPQDDLPYGSYTWAYQLVTESGQRATISGSFQIVSPQQQAAIANTSGSVAGANRVLVTRSVTVQRGKRSAVRFTVKRKSVAQKGLAYVCKVKGRVIARGKTNRRGRGACAFTARSGFTLVIAPAKTKLRTVTVKVRRG